MPDREKVIPALKLCLENTDGYPCTKCPYTDNRETGEQCLKFMMQDVLELITAQDEALKDLRTLLQCASHPQGRDFAVKPVGGYVFFVCGVCNNPLNSTSQKFCSECGRRVRWDD